MTDGIIQQVLNKYTNLGRLRFEIQKELIEKINQESKGLFYDKNRKKIVHWLIGDNKE